MVSYAGLAAAKAFGAGAGGFGGWLIDFSNSQFAKVTGGDILYNSSNVPILGNFLQNYDLSAPMEYAALGLGAALLVGAGIDACKAWKNRRSRIQI